MPKYSNYLLSNVNKEYVRGIYNKMKDRVNNTSHLKEYDYYKDVKIKWKTFDEFYEWFYFEQDSFRVSKRNITRYKYQLDKDLFAERNYDERCVFIPKYINTMIQTQPGLRKNLPLGVTKGRSNNYSVYISILGKSSHICIKRTVKDVMEAFGIYKLTKEFYVKIIAYEFYSRELITDRIYKKLLEYKVKDDSKMNVCMSDMELKQLSQKLALESVFLKLYQMIQTYSIPEINK